MTADWFDPPAGAPVEPEPPMSWGGAWRRFRQNRAAVGGLCVLALLVVAALAGPALAAHPYDQVRLAAENLPPGPGRWFGTDSLGRDVWARTWVGARVSLGIGFGAALLDLGIGAVYGAIAGYAGGALDGAMMRAVDVLYCIPLLLIAVLLLVAFGPGLGPVVLAVALVNWLGMARLVRGEVQRLRRRDYVLAARALGVPAPRILWRHLLPGAAGPMLAWLSYNVPAAIFAEAFLSFVGLGVQPPLTSWGAQIAAGAETFRQYPCQFFFPAAAMSLAMLASYAVSDGVREALQPGPGGDAAWRSWR